MGMVSVDLSVIANRAAGSLLVLAAFGCCGTRAADLGAAPSTDPYSPAAPIGFASEFPRSPLEDIVVNGFQHFATPADAQAHCPHDGVVAVRFFTNRYRPPGSGEAETYMCRTDAVAAGERPDGGR